MHSCCQKLCTPNCHFLCTVIYRLQVVDDTFVFKQKQYKWALKINKAIGAQKLNLHLGQLKINENKMTAFIKEMMKAEEGTRQIIIKKYFEK